MRRRLRFSARCAAGLLWLAAPLLCLPPAMARADDAGLALMRAVDARPQGADQSLRATWRLVAKSGRERVRRIRTYWLDRRDEDDGVHSKRLLVFDAPPDVKDTAFLVVSRRDPAEDDLRWIYLPALRKVRRVSTGDRGKSFVGSEFSYEDLSERDVDEDSHRLLPDAVTGDPALRAVESRPRDPGFPYSRRIQHVHAERKTVDRVLYFDAEGRHAKTLDVRWQQVDGVWLWQRLEMVHQLSGKRTVVEVEDASADDGLADDLFHENSLRYGVP